MGALQFAGSRDAAIETAVKAFAHCGFLFFWNDEQILDLDQRLIVLKANGALFGRSLPFTFKGGRNVRVYQ